MTTFPLLLTTSPVAAAAMWTKGAYPDGTAGPNKVLVSSYAQKNVAAIKSSNYSKIMDLQEIKAKFTMYSIEVQKLKIFYCLLKETYLLILCLCVRIKYPFCQPWSVCLFNIYGACSPEGIDPAAAGPRPA